MSEFRVKVLEEKIDCNQTVLVVLMKELEEKYDKLLQSHEELKKEVNELHTLTRTTKRKRRRLSSC